MFARHERGLVAWTLGVWVLSAGCGGGGGGGGGGELPIDQQLRGRLFQVQDGAALSATLDAEPCDLTFGALTESGGPLTVVAPGVSGLDGFPARVEGEVTIEPPSLLVETSTFDAGGHPDLQPGLTVHWTRLRTMASGELVLQREGDPRSFVSGAPRKRPSFVVILTDDQRWDTLYAMPLTLQGLAARGIQFSNAFVTTPVCAPSRACLLSGGFLAHDTGVLTNGAPNGSVVAFDDSHTIALALRRAGYHTGFFGKYINGYVGVGPYVPPGWNEFVADRGTTSWTEFTLIQGESNATSAQGELVGPIDGYLTDYHAAKTLEFLDQHGDRPFFLLFAPNAPHGPATPAPGDEDLFPGYVYRERAFLEPDVSDKPAYVQNAAYNVGVEDEFHRDQLRSLQALDRAVAGLVSALEQRGQLSDTVFLFTSDNGLQWGEHRLEGKGVPYDESVRVPLIAMWGDGAARTDDHLIAANLDIAATVIDLAALDAPTDGQSLAPLIAGTPPSDWRKELLIESPALGSNRPLLWSGLVAERGGRTWKYAEYGTGERELYDLLGDPFEEENSAAALPALVNQLGALHATLRGLAITTESAPPASVGLAYSLQLETWGGVPPLAWSVEQGTLPDGLTLDPATGLISGVPTDEGTSMVTVRVAGQALGRYTGEPQSFAVELELVVEP